ncbi:MAG: sugar nucleotide epimerase, partial [Pseudonocardiales bacterium]|nr:sugar nucleotide epimerase [Pseudonocardiales bacterium]
MKFVVTGSTGNVSKPLAELLLERGHQVTVVGRDAERLAALVERGADAAVGDLGDVTFLTNTFEGADGVYLMLPPSWSAPDLKDISVQLAEGFAAALTASGVKRAVFLSSYGAHRLADAGPISGMGLAEGVLNRLDNVDVLSLRAGYFYTNLLLSVDHLRTTGELGNMFTIPDGTFTVVDPQDIAEAAATSLTLGDFVGHSYRYVVSDETGTDEIASLIGRELGLPELRWSR